MTSSPRTDWWKTAFRRQYLECYAHRDEAAAAIEAAFVVSLLGVRPGALLLDAGCGAGRHVRALARCGASVVGVDLSDELLAGALAAGDARYVRADVRSLPFRDASFAYVVSLFTSFGYFDDNGDRMHLAELRRVVRPGGRFLIDFLNPSHVITSLVPASSRTVGLYEIQESRFLRNGRIEKEVTLRDTASGTLHAWKESVRLYGRADLEVLLAGAGFDVVSAHGNLAGAPWSDAAERLVLAAVAK